MKVIDVLKLGHKSIVAHKKHSIMTIIAISALFSLLFTVHLVVQGLENKLLESAAKETNGAIYIVTSMCDTSNDINLNDFVEVVDEDTSETHQIYQPEPVSCLVSQADLAKATAKIEKYHGKVIGAIDTSQRQIPLEFVKSAVEVDLAKIEPGAVPVLISMSRAQTLAEQPIGKRLEDSEKLRRVEEIRQKLLGSTFLSDDKQTTFWIAGITSPGTDLTLTKKSDAYNILDLALFNATSSSGGPIIIIDDGSEATKSFLNKNNDHYQVVLSSFTNTQDALNYYHNEDCGIRENACKNYYINELYSNHLGLARNFWAVRTMLGLFEPAFVVIGIIIIVFTFLRLVSQDAPIIALYRSLGATARNVFYIYLAYLVEICCLTILVSMILSLLAALAISLINASSLMAVIAAFYGHVPQTPIILIGFNQRIFYLFGAIVSSAPIASILTIDQLLMKNIAKRLRKR